MTLSTADEQDAPGALSRRTLLRTGAAVAWTVPAVQLVGAAPAFATTSGGVPPGHPEVKPAGSLCWTISKRDKGKDKDTKLYPFTGVATVALKNTGTASSKALLVTLTFDRPVTPGATPAGWTLVGTSGARNTFNYTRDTPLLNDSTNHPVTFTVGYATSSKKDVATGSVTVTPGDGGTAANAQLTSCGVTDDAGDD